VMTNTNGSPPSCPARAPTRVGPREIIDCLSRPCYGSRTLAVHGAICRPILDRGISVYQRFARRSQAQIWPAVLAQLAGDADLEEVFIDSTTVNAHQHAAGAAKKRRTGDRALAWRIEHQDSRCGRRLGYARALSSDGRTGWRQSRGSAFAGRTETRQSGCRQGLRYKRDRATSGIGRHSSCHPGRANRLEQCPLDERLYASRNPVERFFCRIKQFRRVATRYDKLSEQFSSFVALSAAFIRTC
jgi:transposase